MLPITASSLVQRLESRFLENVTAGLASCAFLSETSREDVGRLLEWGVPARVVGDAVFHGLVGDWASRRQVVAEALGEYAGEVPREFTASRLFHPMPSADMMFGVVAPDRREAFLARVAAQSGADHVLEFGYSESISRAVMLAGEDQLDTIHGDLSRVGIAVYGCDDDGVMTLRVPSLTAFEAGLGVFFGKKAARFCLVPGLLPRPELNELHRHGIHAVALPLQAIPVHRAEAEHPAEVALHDVAHTYLWPVPWLRHAGVLLFDAIAATVPAEERSEIDEQEMLLADLAYRNAQDLTAILQNLASRLPRASKLALFWDYADLLDAAFGHGRSSSGLALIKATLRTHLI